MKRWEKELKKIKFVMKKIYEDFEIDIPVLSYPSSIREAWKMYYDLKELEER